MEITELTELKSIMPYLLKHKNLWANYDEHSDTLYLHFKKPNVADDSEMTEENVIVRYENNEVIGVTILNASKNK